MSERGMTNCHPGRRASPGHRGSRVTWMGAPGPAPSPTALVGPSLQPGWDGPSRTLRCCGKPVIQNTSQARLVPHKRHFWNLPLCQGWKSRGPCLGCTSSETDREEGLKAQGGSSTSCPGVGCVPPSQIPSEGLSSSTQLLQVSDSPSLSSPPRHCRQVSEGTLQ